MKTVSDMSLVPCWELPCWTRCFSDFDSLSAPLKAEISVYKRQTSVDHSEHCTVTCQTLPLHLLSPVGPGGDAEQVDREAGLAVGCGPWGGRAGQVEFVLRLQLQRVVESAHHSHREAPEHLLQQLLRQVRTRPAVSGLLPYPNRPGRAAQQEHSQVQKYQQDADPTRRHSRGVESKYATYPARGVSQRTMLPL